MGHRRDRRPRRSHRWLGQHAKARDTALAAATAYAALPDPQAAPTRLAISRLDAALAHAALGEPDTAVATARTALPAGRPPHAVLRRARQLDGQLRRSHPGTATDAFHEELRTLV
ncbi:hypothetical protein [Streptodolium elevatio]|uniref:Uncharacterized protein n=1 Tax=Streptodolium elevatio TaxID=3157996 RepID=A0ABV3DUI9_9ACTN